MISKILALLLICQEVSVTLSWSSPFGRPLSPRLPANQRVIDHQSKGFQLGSSSDGWNGEVVSNTDDGKIKGCSIEPVGEAPVIEWIITIDGYVTLSFTFIDFQ